MNQFDLSFEAVAPKVVSYHIRASWLAIAKLYNDIAKKYDATLSMAFVLLAIDSEKGVPVTKIAPRMGMEPNSLSRIINSMEEKGAIVRISDPKDQRKVYVKLTEKGLEFRIIAFKVVTQLETIITNKMNEEQRAAFFEAMQQIPTAINEFNAKLES